MAFLTKSFVYTAIRSSFAPAISGSTLASARKAVSGPFSGNHGTCGLESGARTGAATGAGGATSARACTSGRSSGYCLQLVVGKGSDRQATDAFISREGEMRLAAAHPAR